MRKSVKFAALALCGALTLTSFTGCGKTDKKASVESDSKSEKAEDVLIADAASYVKLADYATISLSKSEIDKELQSKIDQALEAQVTYEKVKKGKVKKGDTVNIYYVGKIKGKTFEGGSCTKETTPEGYDLEIGSNTFIEGFEDGLIGKKVGQTCDVKTKFPDEYPANADLAGKEAIFTVTINSLRGKKITPKFDDAFVKKNLPEYKSAAEYKEKTRESIVKTKAVEKICKDSKVNKYPDDKLKSMKTQLKTSIEAYLKQNNTTLKDYMTSMNTTEEDFNKQLETTAKEDIAKQLVYNAVAQAEKLEIADADYQKKLKEYLTNYNCKSESELSKSFSENYGTSAKNIIYNDILYDKVAAFLLEKVKES